MILYSAGTVFFIAESSHAVNADSIWRTGSKIDKLSNGNTNLMQHCAGFISAGSLYMFRASSAHHHEYLKLVQRPLVHVLSLQVSHHISLLGPELNVISAVTLHVSGVKRPSS